MWELVNFKLEYLLHTWILQHRPLLDFPYPLLIAKWNLKSVLIFVYIHSFTCN